MKPWEAEGRSEIKVNLSFDDAAYYCACTVRCRSVPVCRHEVQMFACGCQYVPKLAAQPMVPKSMACGFFASVCHLLPYEMFWGVRDIKDFWEV